MRLLLVRHGEATWNSEGRYQGRLDPPLSDLGERQARAVSERLARENVPTAVFSSPLTRSRRTAEIILAKLATIATQPLELSLDERLIEISHGAWQGLVKDEIERRWPAMLANWRTKPESVTFPGGESLADVLRRWRSFLEATLEIESTSASALVIVTHDVIIRLAVLDARQKPLSDFSTLQIDNGSITTVEFDRGEGFVRRLNDVSHLGLLRSDLAAQAL